MRRFLILVTLTGLAGLGAPSVFAGPKTVSVLEDQLKAGKLSAAEAILDAELKANPQDAETRFALGTVQFLRAIEGLSQGLYRHGVLQQQRELLIGADLPIPLNPQPQKISYQQSRQIIQDFVSGLTRAEATLAQIGQQEIKLPLHFGLIRLDLDGDGTATEEETLWKVYSRVNRRTGANAAEAEQFVIGFDTGDVYWLRGYCHLLMALGEVALAHDYRELFERAGHVLFPSVDSPYPFLNDYPQGNQNNLFSYNRIVDFIAYIHLINFPVAAPERMAAALQHLETMMDVSTRSWDFIERETDNDHEWIPNSKQTGVIPNVRVTQDMIASWRNFLAESKEILQGKKLIPFWRGDERGVNLRLVFTQPRPFDLVMWFQGTGAAPYLQHGTKTDQDVWNRLRRVFGGEFVGFALWFN